MFPKIPHKRRRSTGRCSERLRNAASDQADRCLGWCSRSVDGIFTDEAIHRLADEIGVTDVARVLLDHVDQQPAQAWRTAIGPGSPGQTVQAAVGQRLGNDGARATHGLMPDRRQLLWRAVSSRVPLPVRIGISSHHVPGRAQLLSKELHAEGMVLHEREVLDQSAQGDRRDTDRRPQAILVQSATLPRQVIPLALQRTDQGLDLATGGGGLGR